LDALERNLLEGLALCRVCDGHASYHDWIVDRSITLKMKISKNKLNNIIKEVTANVLKEQGGAFTYTVIEDEFDGGPKVEIEGIPTTFDEMIQSLEGKTLDFGDEPPFKFSVSLFGGEPWMMIRDGVAPSYIEMWAEMNGYEAKRSGAWHEGKLTRRRKRQIREIIAEETQRILTENAELVAEAFANTDPEYLARSIEQRTPGPNSAGSTFSQATSIEDLKAAKWEPYAHPAIASPAIGFKAPIPGSLGIADINNPSIPDEIYFQPAHGGRAMTKEPNPDTGELEVLAEVVASIPDSARNVSHTTLIIGPMRDNPDKLQVWTFFPGDPTPELPEITMREVKQKYNWKAMSQVIPGTKQDAIDMGYGFVKHANK